MEKLSGAGRNIEADVDRLSLDASTLMMSRLPGFDDEL
jgi:hypothetical protein